MPEMFSAMYDPMVDEWIRWKVDSTKNVVRARDPMTKEVVEVGTTLYADDISELNLTWDAEEMEEVIENCTRELDEGLKRKGMAQNMDKAEHVVTFKGEGAKMEHEKVTNGKVKWRNEME